MDSSSRRKARDMSLEVAALPAAEMDAAILRLCESDAEILAEVRAILDADSSGLSDSATIADARSSETLLHTPLEERPGSRIGPYKLLAPIGEGGFGSVFMAEQERPVQRRVALKIIKLGMDTRQVVARFEQERQALALMDHPNIAKVFDAGATDAGRPYFVMELCKGEPITDYCDRLKLSIPDRLELFVQVCQAVQHAHQKALIHRDIKPSNILVSSEDGRPTAKVIDFGIAKATATKLTDKTLFTRLEQMIGTPEYMSPEQAEGSLDIDTRTDVYSLGVLLYELLTGSTPFDSKSLRSAAHAEIQRIIREVEPPKPSARLSQSRTTVASVAAQRKTEPRKLGTIVRGELDWIVMKALEKDRSRRYETANGLAMDIQRYLSNEPVTAGPPGVAYRVRKFIKRNRVTVSAGAIVAAALLIGAAAFAWQARQARIAADIAERAAYQAQIVSAAHAVEDQRIDAATALLAATSPRRRGWEYTHLISRLDRTLPSPFPADWLISGIVSLADSRVVAVRRSVGGGPVEWIVLERDLRTPRLVLPDTEPYAIQFSPDGTRVLWAPPMPHSVSAAVLWDIESKSALATIPIEHNPAANVSLVVTWSPSGKGDRVLISHVAGYQIHDGYTGARLRSDKAGGYMYFAGDEHWMVLSVSENDVRVVNPRAFLLVDAHTFQSTGEIFKFATPVSQVVLRESKVLCALEDGTLRLLEIVNGALRERTRIVAGITNFDAPTWSRDGRMVAAGSIVSGRVRAWEADSGALLGDFGGPQAGVATQWFLPDSGDLWACDVNGHHRVWPIKSGSPGVLTAHKSYVYPAVISKDGSLLLTGGWDGLNDYAGGLKLWDARTGAPVGEHGKPGDIFRCADLTADGRYAVIGVSTGDLSNHRFEVLDLINGSLVATLTTASTFPSRAIIHPDGKRVISTYVKGRAYVWELMTGNILWQSDQKQDSEAMSISATAALSPDGRILAFADRQLGIRLVNANTYADIRRWDAHTEGIWSLSFSPDGKWLLSGSDDQTVGVWDVATGKLVARLVGHGAKVLCAAMSPDGTRIASGGRDGIVRLWDTTHFENVAQLAGHADYVYGLTWSPDGKQLISTSGDSTVRIWDTRTLAEQLAAIEHRAQALPALEAQVATGRLNPQTLATAPNLTPRERELARKIVAHFAFNSTPARYRAPRARLPIVIDGKIDDAAWNAAPWSDPFVDIEGDAKPKPRFETRIRMLWDDSHLYIAAKLEEPHAWGTLGKRDEIVFNDNDFEVFIDPDGDTRNYYELEFNALNTVFDLLLVRTYHDGGPAKHDWNVAGLRSAVHVDGTLNDASDVDKGWTIELALPWSSLAEYANRPSPPRRGDVWRINFSRVQWQHDVVGGQYVKRPKTKEDNWVWTPQNVVNMHVPERWGFVEFMDDGK